MDAKEQNIIYEFEPNDWCSYAEREEDVFDLTYKTYDELVEAFNRKGALDKKDYMEAIENTNLLYDCEFYIPVTAKVVERKKE